MIAFTGDIPKSVLFKLLLVIPYVLEAELSIQ